MSKREPVRPRGRDEVMDAVRAAAADLLAERGPAVISVRDIAERAGVNHALVHRHFGTKDELLRAVVADLSAQLGSAVAPGGVVADDLPALLQQLRAHTAYWQIMARAVLDAPHVLQPGPTSAASSLLAALGGPSEPDDSTRVAAAVAGSLVLGWIVFGTHLSTVLDVPGADALDDAIADTLARILTRRGR